MHVVNKDGVGKITNMAKKKLKFGKYKGWDINRVFEIDPSYIKWLYENMDKGSPAHNMAADLLEGPAEKAARTRVARRPYRAGKILDQQFKKALQNND